jgi:DNA phosphorothioation-associated putative methyltransferase
VDIVNLGYVVNVIESPEERDSTLREAWDLCRKALIVSAQILIAGRGSSHVEFGDGVLTTRNTFQRYYRQEELKTYVEQLLSREAVPAALGVFYVFRDETLAHEFLSRRYRRRELVPSRELTLSQFDANRAILEPFMAKIAELGRVPGTDECPNVEKLLSRFGSLKRAYALVRQATSETEWNEITRRAGEDLLVYLALGKFQGRPPISVLPLALQRDISAEWHSEIHKLLVELGIDRCRPPLVKNW